MTGHVLDMKRGYQEDRIGAALAVLARRVARVGTPLRPVYKAPARPAGQPPRLRHTPPLYKF